MIALPNQLNVLVVAGTTSNSGKTTLVCDLLRRLTAKHPWEAIKLTRGHYRSCGKDPHTCCVSDLLGEQATVRSGRAATYTTGKDTGRYWDAGASNVHWVIATDEQVEAGITAALARVTTAGVIIEGTSVLRYLEPAFAILAINNKDTKLKPSARFALNHGKVQALYVADARQPLALAEFARLPVYDATQHDALCERLSPCKAGLL